VAVLRSICVIIFLLCGFFFFIFPRLISAVEDWMYTPYFHTWCSLSANLGCRSDTCCTWLAKNTGRKISKKNSPSAHHRTILSGYILATKPHIDNKKKNLLSSNISSRSPHNIVNFGPLAAKICWRVWGTRIGPHSSGFLYILPHCELIFFNFPGNMPQTF